MSIQLDGYRVGRTQSLEDLGAELSVSLGATAEQIWIENPSSSISRSNELGNAMNETVLTDDIGEPVGPLADIGIDFAPRPDFTFKSQQRKGISKQEADKKVSEAGVKLDIGENGIPEAALNILIQRKREEVKRQALIDSAPSGFWSGAAQIGTGLAVSIADPLNVASAFVPIIGQARYAKLLATAGTAGGRAGVRAGVGAVEGVVGAAIIEPVVLAAANAEQADYGLYDSYMNLTFGAVLGGGLHSGLGAIGDVIGKSSPGTKEALLKSAVGQAMNDQPIDIGYVASADSNFQKAWADSEGRRLEIESIREELLPIAGEKITRGDLKKATTELNDLEFKASKLEAERQALIESPQKKGKKKKFDDIKTEADSLSSKIDTVKAAIKKNELASEAFADISRIEQGLTPERFTERVTTAGQVAADQVGFRQAPIRFEASAPRIDTNSPEASPVAARQAQESLDSKLDETPETLDTLTNDIMTALDESGLDSVAIRAEIDDINKTADQDAAGLREALMCAIGK